MLSVSVRLFNSFTSASYHPRKFKIRVFHHKTILLYDNFYTSFNPFNFLVYRTCWDIISLAYLLIPQISRSKKGNSRCSKTIKYKHTRILWGITIYSKGTWIYGMEKIDSFTTLSFSSWYWIQKGGYWTSVCVVELGDIKSGTVTVFSEFRIVTETGCGAHCRKFGVCSMVAPPAGFRYGCCWLVCSTDGGTLSFIAVGSVLNIGSFLSATPKATFDKKKEMQTC